MVREFYLRRCVKVQVEVLLSESSHWFAMEQPRFRSTPTESSSSNRYTRGAGGGEEGLGGTGKLGTKTTAQQQKTLFLNTPKKMLSMEEEKTPT